MIDYEALLFEVAPWSKEVMLVAKTINNGYFMRGRSGWINRGIMNPESVYEHDCKVGLAAWYLFGTKEAVVVGLSHDFPEILEPDYIPGQISKSVKQTKEDNAMKQLAAQLPDGQLYYNAWKKFEYGEGIGSQIKELDRNCPCIQARDYMKKYNNNRLDEFYPNARGKLTVPVLVELLDKMQTCHIPKSESAYETYFRELEKIRI